MLAPLQPVPWQLLVRVRRPTLQVTEHALHDSQFPQVLLPAQDAVLQLLVCKDWPVHPDPMQLRWRAWDPPPQVNEQDDQLPHKLQDLEPSTYSKKKYVYHDSCCAAACRLNHLHHTQVRLAFGVLYEQLLYYIALLHNWVSYCKPDSWSLHPYKVLTCCRSSLVNPCLCPMLLSFTLESRGSIVGLPFLENA